MRNLDKKSLIRLAEQGRLTVRNMCGSDLSQVLTIENNAQESPWGRLSFEESLTREHICRIVEVCDDVDSPLSVVAYHVVCSIVDELHILNVVSSSQYRGIGLGHRLMQDIFEIARKQNLKRIFLEVRASNEIAQSLYKKWGFRQAGVREKYYRQTLNSSRREDALIYICDEL